MGRNTFLRARVNDRTVLIHFNISGRKYAVWQPWTAGLPPSAVARELVNTGAGSYFHAGIVKQQIYFPHAL